MIVIKNIRVIDHPEGRHWELDVAGFVHPDLEHTHCVPEKALESKRVQYDMSDDATDEDVLEVILDEVWTRYRKPGQRPKTDYRAAIPHRDRPSKGGERKR